MSDNDDFEAWIHLSGYELDIEVPLRECWQACAELKQRRIDELKAQLRVALNPFSNLDDFKLVGINKVPLVPKPQNAI